MYLDKTRLYTGGEHMSSLIFQYLHESAIDTQLMRRIDDKMVLCHLGDGSTYHINVDVRDRRALVVFDGEVLFGGLPKNATIVHTESIGMIFCREKAMRKESACPCAAYPKYQYEIGRIGVELSRYFILLPSCKAIVRKYRQKNLSPVYVIICVQDGLNGKKIVEWQTTSF
jgi:hypothetical protein